MIVQACSWSVCAASCCILSVSNIQGIVSFPAEGTAAGPIFTAVLSSGPPFPPSGTPHPSDRASPGALTTKKLTRGWLLAVGWALQKLNLGPPAPPSELSIEKGTPAHKVRHLHRTGLSVCDWPDDHTGVLLFDSLESSDYLRVEVSFSAMVSFPLPGRVDSLHIVVTDWSVGTSKMAWAS